MQEKTLEEWVNPIVEQRADPWMMRHTDGYYYFLATVPSYDYIEMRRAKTIGELSKAETEIVWKQHEFGEMCHHIWAPELHYVGNKWYIYFAAAHQKDEWQIRMYVLECNGDNPMTGRWVERGEIRTKWESFSLDATTFEHQNKQYLVWAQKDDKIDTGTNLYIDEMMNPWTLSGKQIMLTKPEHDWECQGYSINEGPAILKTKDKLYLTYSASKTDHHYCMGLLEINCEAQVLEPLNWHKHTQPIFETSIKNKVYGPGHNSFVVSQSGKELIMVYHARDYLDIEGDPLNDPNRHTRAQRIRVTDTGIECGEPVLDGVYKIVGSK